MGRRSPMFMTWPPTHLIACSLTSAVPKMRPTANPDDPPEWYFEPGQMPEQVAPDVRWDRRCMVRRSVLRGCNARGACPRLLRGASCPLTAGGLGRAAHTNRLGQEARSEAGGADQQVRPGELDSLAAQTPG